MPSAIKPTAWISGALEPQFDRAEDAVGVVAAAVEGVGDGNGLRAEGVSVGKGSGGVHGSRDDFDQVLRARGLQGPKVSGAGGGQPPPCHDEDNRDHGATNGHRDHGNEGGGVDVLLEGWGAGVAQERRVEEPDYEEERDQGEPEHEGPPDGSRRIALAQGFEAGSEKVSVVRFLAHGGLQEVGNTLNGAWAARVAADTRKLAAPSGARRGGACAREGAGWRGACKVAARGRAPCDWTDMGRLGLSGVADLGYLWASGGF